MRNCRKAFIFLAILLPSLSIEFIPAAYAVPNVIATGTNPGVCDQTVGDPTSVIATRITGGDCVIEFKNVGTTSWTAPAVSGQARILVVGGGGGGGAHVGSGGGAGGLIESSTATFTKNSSVSITIGGGGAGAKLFTAGCTNPNGSSSGAITGELILGSTYCNTSSKASRSFDGGDSSIIGGGTSVTARGGGGGGSWNYFYPHVGGSGGGAASTSPAAASGTTGQGNSGGAYVGTYGTGGGGGAGAAGSVGANNAGGNGGAGLTITTFGGSRDLAGGGGGGTHTTGTGGSATHGGGAGSVATTVKAANGTANTGGGGGGTGNTNGSTSEGGNGGSGIVLIRYTPYVESVISAPRVTANVYKGITMNLIVDVNGPGKVRFFQDGKKIANCLAISTVGSYPNYTATCSWKPTVTASHKITASFTPSDSAFGVGTSSPAVFWVLKRSTTR